MRRPTLILVTQFALLAATAAAAVAGFDGPYLLLADRPLTTFHVALGLAVLLAVVTVLGSIARVRARHGRRSPLTLWTPAAAILGAASLYLPFSLGGTALGVGLMAALAIVGAGLLGYWLGGRAPRQPGQEPVVAVIVFWALAGALVPFMSVYLVFASWTRTTVLTPTGPDGCRIVVAESSFFGTSGRVHAVAGPWALVRDKGAEFEVEDSIPPVAEGRCRLTWAGDDAVLVIEPRTDAATTITTRCR